MTQPSDDHVGSSALRTALRLVLGAALVFAGVSHLSFARTSFYAQVPPWLPMNADFVVISPGIVEIALGAALLFLPLLVIWALWSTGHGPLGARASSVSALGNRGRSAERSTRRRPSTRRVNAW